MSYTVDEVKQLLKRQTLKTEIKDSTRNKLWLSFRAIYEEKQEIVPPAALGSQQSVPLPSTSTAATATASAGGGGRDASGVGDQSGGAGLTKHVLPFVVCVRCDAVFSYDSAKGGTSHLRRHEEACCNAMAPTTPSIFNFFKTPRVPKAAKDRVTEKCVEFVCKDIRPFTTVAGDGFIDLAQTLINVGVKYGQLNASDLLPHPTTVSRHVSDKAEAIKAALVMPDIVKYVNRWGGGITTDMWTECYTQTSYITVTLHYIDDNWQLVARTLATREFEEQRHTGVNIKIDLDKILREFGIDEKKIYFVTDRGANMLAALKNSNHISCCDHIINTILSHVFDAKNLDNIPEVRAILTASKDLVRYFKKSGAMHLLTKSLKQEVPTRWNSMYYLLQSVQEVYTEIEHILDTKSERFRWVALLNVLQLHFLNTFCSLSAVDETANPVQTAKYSLAN